MNLMKLFDIDSKLAKLGYVKQEETEHGTVFRKREIGYDHTVEIVPKMSGCVMIYSYDSTNTTSTWSPQVALSVKETRLFLKKARQLMCKYRWEKN